MTLEVATTTIDDDGFTVGDVTADPPETDPVPSDWIVSDQKPNPGVNKAFGDARSTSSWRHPRP